jgi:hypothetical protein
MLALWKTRATAGREFSDGGTADKPARLPVAAAQKSVPALRPPALRLPVKPLPRARLVFAVDATSSRSEAWEVSQKLTGKLFSAVPGELDVALAVHGGGKVHTFTPFLPDAAPLRKLAAKVRCKAGYTALLDILARVLRTEGVGVVVYIGDVFEESETKALKLADALKRHETRVIILHDHCSRDFDDGEVFRAIAERTGGAVLPFNISALEQLGQLLEAVAVLAVGGVEGVEAVAETMPAAPLLLEHLGTSKHRALR